MILNPCYAVMHGCTGRGCVDCRLWESFENRYLFCRRGFLHNSEFGHIFLRVHSADVGHEHLKIASPWQGRNHASKVREPESGSEEQWKESEEGLGEPLPRKFLEL